MKGYIIMPKSVVSLAAEIKLACDDYWLRKITEQELRELLYILAENTKLLESQDLNRSVKKIIGKKRITLVQMLLKEYPNNPDKTESISV